MDWLTMTIVIASTAQMNREQTHVMMGNFIARMKVIYLHLFRLGWYLTEFANVAMAVTK